MHRCLYYFLYFTFWYGGLTGICNGQETLAFKANNQNYFIGSYRYLSLFSDNEPRKIVIAINKEKLEIESNVLIHTSINTPIKGVITNYSFFQYKQESVKIPCGIIAIQDTNIVLPEYFLVTPLPSDCKGSIVEEIVFESIRKVDPRLVKMAKDYVKAQIRKPLHFRDWGWKEERIQQLNFKEEYAIREFRLSKRTKLTFISYKMVDIPDSSNINNIYGTPYHRHELMAFVKGSNDSINAYYGLTSLSWAGGDGTSDFRTITPGEFINESILGVYDVEPDQIIEVIIEGIGAESGRVSVIQLHKGKINKLNISFTGGL